MKARWEKIQPAEWPAPRGYSNGVVTRGTIVHVGGQVGWDATQRFVSDDFVAQFAQALDNVIAVVRAAGGSPEDIARMTVYVTDLPAYRQSLPALGSLWKSRLGRHYPAMALVGVTGLVEPEARVEIEALAVLHDASMDTPP